MATPRNNTYSVGSGGSVYAGKINAPAWLTAAVQEWATIPGTIGGQQLGQFYSGIALRDDPTRVELAVPAAGGHNNGGVWDRQNRVQAIRLDVDAPAWVTREPDSDPTGWDGNAPAPGVQYFPSDNAPVPRHLYDSVQWMPQMGCYLIGGDYAGYTAQIAITEQRGYVPAGDSAGDWAARGSYPNLPAPHCLLACVNQLTGDGLGRDVFTGQHYRVSGITGAWTPVTLSGATTVMAPGGLAFEPVRNRVVQISGGGWLTQASGTATVWMDYTTGVTYPITFNASAAWTDFQANASKFVGSALVWAPNLGCFFFYNGNTGSPILSGQSAKVYRITPRSDWSQPWDMQILDVTGVTPPNIGAGLGVYCKFRYIRRWSTLVLAVDGANVHYLRVA